MAQRPVATCYMCDSAATSREHVPAACFFPEQKDLPAGVDLRSNLFTVPSCDVHNSHKSEDDQYLWLVIMAVRGLNEFGELMARTKGLRSIKERPAVVDSFMRTATPILHFDSQTGEWQETVKAHFDIHRVFTVLGHFGRALYFLHFNEKWGGRIAVFPNFASFGEAKGAEARDYRRDWRAVIELSARQMAPLDRIGQNQEAFYYQVMPPGMSSSPAMRAMFYGTAAVTIGFLPGVEPTQP
jgi:hypothetical protein